MQLGHCVMPTRCVSPQELNGVGQSLYFDASEINVTEKRKYRHNYIRQQTILKHKYYFHSLERTYFLLDQNLVLVAIPVVFEKTGQIRVVLDVHNNGVKEVILNPGDHSYKEKANVAVIEVFLVDSILNKQTLVYNLFN